MVANFTVNRRRFFLTPSLFLVVACLVGGSLVRGGDAHPELTRLSPTEAIWFDPQQKQLVVEGKVVLATGPLELLACPVGSKEHEAILAVYASARLVHTGLLAIGLTPGRPARFGRLPQIATGPRVRVDVRWRDADGRLHHTDAREWIRHVRTGDRLQQDWVFCGGGCQTDEGTAGPAGDTADLICVANFPTALLDLPVESSQENGLLNFEAFPDRIPPVGTTVELVLSAAG